MLKKQMILELAKTTTDVHEIAMKVNCKLWYVIKTLKENK